MWLSPYLRENMNKKELIRLEATRVRDNIDLSLENIDAVAEILLDNFNVDSNLKISLYWPKGREFPTFPIMDVLKGRGVDFSLPVISKNTKKLDFYVFQGEGRLEEFRNDIYQPIVDDESVLVASPDVIICPLLAFDQRGYRIGYGGGYYDCTISELKKHGHSPSLIGLAYSTQACLFPLPIEDHDEKMDAIITPNGFIKY